MAREACKEDSSSSNPITLSNFIVNQFVLILGFGTVYVRFYFFVYGFGFFLQGFCFLGFFSCASLVSCFFISILFLL